VRRLDEKQRNFLAEFYNKISLMSAGALIFGQFVPGKTINLWVVTGGMVIVLILMWSAVKLKRQPQ
jgi:hypothetical protein